MYRIASNRLFRTENPTMKNDETKRPSMLDNLIQATEWRGRHGRQYDRSEDLEALLQAAAEAVATGAEKVQARLPAVLELRRRLLRPFASMAPGSYAESEAALQRVLAECIVAVAARFVHEVERMLDAEIRSDAGDHLLEIVSHRAAAILDRARSEDATLTVEVAVALTAERSFPAANDDARMVRIAASYEENTGKRVPPDAELAALTGLLASDLVTEPRVFADNLRRVSPQLCGNDTAGWIELPGADVLRQE